MASIVVSGGTGFLGSWLSRFLVSEGHSVTVLCRVDSSTWRLGLDFAGDVVALDESQWPNFLIKNCFSVFVSCDWAGVEGAERNEPIQLGNTKRIVDCLTAFAIAGGHHYVGVGSQAEYGNPNCRISEDAVCTPLTLYGQTKLKVCQQTAEILRGTSVIWSWARIFSTYGPLDIGSWLLNSAIDSFRSNETMQVTLCEQLWSYLYAADAARALAIIALSENSDGIYNVGHPLAPPLYNTLELLHRLMRTESKLDIGAIAYREDQVMVLHPDVSKLQKLAWSPKVSLEDGLLKAAAWRNGDLIEDPFSKSNLPIWLQHN
ncbi:MAG: NAD(P)-dependent oxidoreductase [Gammaproteobacteria bacterium]